MEAVDESQIVDSQQADIVVIGAGHAGTAVARRAAEGGKKVILVEAQAEDAYFIIGNDIGHINSNYLKEAGVPEVDPLELYTNWMVRCQNAAHPDLIMQFVQNCGAAVDWFLEDVDQEYLDTMTISYWPRNEHMLDEIADQGLLGKPVGSDRQQGKYTFLTTLGLDECARRVGALTDRAIEALRSLPESGHLAVLARQLAQRGS